jgi:hypothetical protein
MIRFFLSYRSIQQLWRKHKVNDMEKLWTKSQFVTFHRWNNDHYDTVIPVYVHLVSVVLDVNLICEIKFGFCFNVPCQNNGVCRPLLLNYRCECLGDSYSDRHCEITATKIIIYKIVSKSFAYVAIIAIVSVAMFIVIMDILKYCFGIDPVDEERERMRRKKLLFSDLCMWMHRHQFNSEILLWWRHLFKLM